MPDQLRDIVTRMVDAGESEENIAAVIQRLSAPAPSGPSTASRVTGAFPAVGGLIGSVLGGSKATPVGMGLAAIGGAGGEAYRQVADSIRGDFSNIPDSIGGRLKQIGTEGLKQGAFEGGGRAVGGVLQGAGRMLYRGLLKPSKAVRQEFGDVAPALLDARRIISKGGAEAADTAVEQSAERAHQLIASHAPTATDIPAREIIQEYAPVVAATRSRIRAGVIPEGEMAKIGQRGRRMVKTGGVGGIDVSEAQTLKKSAQDASAGAYKQMRAGHVKQLGTDDLLDAATARGLKQGIERRVPGVREANAETQGLIGQSRALDDAVGRTGNHLPFGSVSDLAAMSTGSPLLGMLGKASTMAGPGSSLAIGLNEIGRLPHAQAIRLLDLLMREGSHQQ